ncbi:MAG: glycosyltransferase family A protein [Ruminococcus bromii]|nr:glycosyltransferase family A protein [Ruminococcus bromii]
MNKIVSVIIPAYNAEMTVKRCVESIQNQTYKSLEIIVINDGSTDKTAECVSELAVGDKRIKLISIDNNGVSHARNVGIDNASGDYITFVDSDDTIDAEMYECLVDLMDKYDADITHCSYKNINSDGSIVCVGNAGKVVSQSKNDAIKCLISGTLFAGGMWNKLYKLKLLNNLRLDESIVINEDLLMNFELFQRANKNIVYTDKAFYNYYANEDSSTHSRSSLRKSKEGLYVSEKILSMSADMPYKAEAENRVACSSLRLLSDYFFADDKSKYKKERRKLMDKVLKYKEQNLYGRKNDRIIISMLRFVPGLYVCAYSVYDKLRKKKLDPEQNI